jgi:amino acid adenylation domain-containing protein
MADLLTRFAQVARTAPGRAAVRAGATVLTFADLDTRTAGLAAALRGRGIRRGDRVGVCLPRCAELVAALLAVWRAGAAFVPLDPGYPEVRLAEMAAGASITALIHRGPRPAWAGAADSVAADAGQGMFFADDQADGLAYVIYTSGSSGRPKGVLITHSCVASLVTALETAGVYAREPRVVAWNASVSFDASVKQWARVCRGDTIVVLDEADRTNPERLRALLDAELVSDLDLTPTHWELLREDLLPPAADGRVLRLLMGGEPVPERTWREIAGAAGLDGVSVYGPTECTVDVMAAPMTGDRPRLGRALPGSTLYVLDDGLRPVPPGAVGELFVAGPQLALGYLDRPGLTARTFLPDPAGSGTRLYRTGDLVRCSAGEYTFIGRTDRQVKWLGVRIEPGEIEHHLREHPAVAAAVVVVRAERLVAHVVPAGDPATPAELQRHLAARLPESMIPSKIVLADTLPVTPNGKLDLAVLATPTACP